MVPALLITLVISALLGALLYGLVFRPLRNAPPLAKAVASLGVLVILQGSMANRMGTTPVIVQAIYPSERWTWQDMTLLSDRAYLAITVVVLDAGDHRALPLDPIRSRHPRRGRVGDRRVRQRHLARPHRVAELDAGRCSCRRGGDPHRPALAGGAEHLHPVRRPGARRRDRGRVPVPHSGGGGRHRDRDDPGVADLPLREVLLDAPVRGGRDRAAGGDADRAAVPRTRQFRCGGRSCAPHSGAPRGRGRTRCRSSWVSSSARWR